MSDELYWYSNMQTYEVEVKSLLGAAEKADKLRSALKSDPSCKLVSQSKQLNHYFDGSTLDQLALAIGDRFSTEAQAKLDDFIKRAQSFSVRTRLSAKAGKETVLFVIKASVGDDTSANGVARMELEEQVPLSLEELDSLILSAGFTYQAKWSREREEYAYKGVTITLDKNAGYGWLAEFELVVDSEAKVAAARAEIDALMRSLDVSELPQDRLERMFAYYNTHWPEYYGTDQIFTVE